jgi:flagellar hook-associated protein 2
MANTLFAGSSRYSQDFAAVIERQVGIASLALTQMQKARFVSADRISALRSIESKVTALQGSLKAIEDGVNSNAFLASSSDNTSVRATMSSGAATGSYTLRVTSLGSYSNAVSNLDPDNKISDPGAGNFVAAGITQVKLRITDHNTGTPATTETTIDLTGGTSLQDVVDSINSKTGLNVQAAVVNLGTTAEPNYALSLQSTRLGKLAIQLQSGSTELMNVNEADPSDPALGSRAEYKINGATVLSDTRNVTLAPKLTVDLLKADATKDITVTVARSTTAVQGALTTFIAAYNAVLDEADNFTGKGGVLAGESLVGGVRQQLRSIVDGVKMSGDLDSLSKIGLEFTSTGRLSLNSSLFSAETANKFDALKSLIGTSSTSGFMRTATDGLNTLESSSGGMLKDTIDSLDQSLKSEDARIEAEQARVERFTSDLQDRLAKADAMIAALEQQANYFNNMFEAMRTNQKSMS